MTDGQVKKPEKITTLAQLREHLQTALELEHMTIPAYLTALYSIHQDSNPEAELAIRGVVVEEMLHLTLAANVLNAVGGQPSINSERFVPKYPRHLPHSANPLIVGLQRFSPDVVDAFMAIEAPCEDHELHPEPDEYHTIGDFYEAIAEGIDTLVDELGVESVFTGQLSRQVQPHHYYGGSGKLRVVTCPASAHLAIKEIIDQGEGAEEGRLVWEEAHREVTQARLAAAHYYRFEELKLERFYVEGNDPGKPSGEFFDVNYQAVWPIATNVKMEHFDEGSSQRQVLTEFNRSYKDFLNMLHTALNGRPDLIADSVPLMYDLKYKAVAIMKIPLPDHSANLAPTWEWVPG